MGLKHIRKHVYSQLIWLRSLYAGQPFADSVVASILSSHRWRSGLFTIQSTDFELHFNIRVKGSVGRQYRYTQHYVYISHVYKLHFIAQSTYFIVKLLWNQ